MTRIEVPADKMISPSAASDILGVHPETISDWASRGKLACLRTEGGHRRFRMGDLLALRDKLQEPLP